MNRELSPSLLASVRDAMWFSVMLGAAESYFSAYGAFLGGSAFQIGVLATLPVLLGSMSQLLSLYLLGSGAGRRSRIVVGARVQALVLIPIALLYVLPLDTGFRVTALIMLVTLYFVAGNVVAPIWNSLIGDLVPPTRRGEFFGYRNRSAGFVTVLVFIASGVLLSLGQSHGIIAFIFPGLFLIGAFARFISSRYLQEHEDPPFEQKQDDDFSFWSFIRKGRRSNFLRFVVFIATTNFAVFVSAPYFVLYMLRVLHWSLGEYMVAVAVQLVTQFLFMQHWGTLSDQFGNKKVLTLSSLGLAVIPFFWGVSGNFYFLLVVQAYSGIVWAGFNLASFNFLFDAVSPSKRARCTAFMSCINGVFVFLGAMVGAQALGLFVRHELGIGPLLDGSSSPYLSVFLLSSILRLGAVLLLGRAFDDVREVDKISHAALLYRVASVRAWAGPRLEVVGIVKNKPESDIASDPSES